MHQAFVLAIVLVGFTLSPLTPEGTRNIACDAGANLACEIENLPTEMLFDMDGMPHPRDCAVGWTIGAMQCPPDAEHPNPYWPEACGNDYCPDGFPRVPRGVRIGE